MDVINVNLALEKRLLAKRRSVMIAAMLIITAVVFFTYLKRDAIYAQMNAWLLIPKPERFTELYFSDHTNLPKRVSAGDRMRFSFVIVNHEGNARSYGYSVHLIGAENVDPIVVRDVTDVASEESKEVQVGFDVPERFETGEVVVQLTDMSQQIHFWINKPE
ncbi:MAG: hypothetical protein HGA31_04370 [Candidatus Moranbacteria bacterium]|nr:hypothetical protein [Candidatus Moranbacteria bacterium]